MRIGTDAVGIKNLAWPIEQLGEAMRAVATASELTLERAEAPELPPGLKQGNPERLERWVEAAAESLGIEAEPVQVPYGELEPLVLGVGPALVRLGSSDEPRFLALLAARRGRVIVIAPDLTRHRLRPEVVRQALGCELEAPLIAGIDAMLSDAGVPERRWGRARSALLRERLGTKHLGGMWLLRLPPGANVWHQAREAGLGGLLLAYTGAYSGKLAAWLLSWWVLGWGALGGHLDWGWLMAWVLLLITNLPLRLLELRLQGLLAIQVGELLKRRLLEGTFKLAPEEIRHQGAGGLLGRVIESEALETLALSGGILTFSHSIDILVAVPILVAGAGGWLHALLLMVWTVCLGLLSWRYLGERRRWTRERLDITGDLVERMVGHRTRLAQEDPRHWHAGEDQAVERYLAHSQTMDRTAMLIRGLAPRGWLVLGLVGLAPAFALGGASSVALAIGIGGTLFVYQSLGALSEGLLETADAVVAWEQVAPLFHAAARVQTRGTPAFALGPESASGTVIETRELSFRHDGRSEPVLRGCNLRVLVGERLLLEGPSGGGKSTLASLLLGLRLPESGLLLVGGLDRQTLGAGGWRRWVAAAPQFHENYVFTGPFAFNLLMARRWPPTTADVAEAEALCRELGLGDLLERMPAGIWQMVGETGWQLSHGERGRLFVARALLQGSELVIFDESFAALDPLTLKRALVCVCARAPTLIVIAHP